MWAETNQALQTIHKYVSGKQLESSEVERRADGGHTDGQNAAFGKETEINGQDEKNWSGNADGVASVPPIVSGGVAEDLKDAESGTLSSYLKYPLEHKLLVASVLVLCGLFGYYR